MTKLHNLKLNQVDITASIRLDEAKKHQNILAYATITIRDDFDEYITISGFTVWISKHGGYNVTPPSKKNFKYCCGSLLKRIKALIIKEYECVIIPVINDE